MGLGGIEPPTSALSVLRSNQLSYSPADGRVTIPHPRSDAHLCPDALPATSGHVEVVAATRSADGIANVASGIDEQAAWPAS